MITTSEKSNEIKTPTLKIRGKTLIFANSVYQISNIASVSLVDLSAEKSMPKYFLWMLIGGIVLLFIPMNQLRVLGVIILGVLIWQFIEYQKNKLTERYGVGLELSSGTTTVIISKDWGFLKKIVLVINEIMNSEELKALTIHMDQRTINEDQSININKMIGSNLNTGTVHGDIVNNV
ncbi:MAG: DUF6232 family protein [Cyanobacteria bacterium P01_E01_bin.42]